MIGLQIAILLLAACAGTAVVLTRKLENQVIGISFFGLILALMFFLFQSPDVALSQIVIGSVGLPLMVLLALAKLQKDNRLRDELEKQRGRSAKPDPQSPTNPGAAPSAPEGEH